MQRNSQTYGKEVCKSCSPFSDKIYGLGMLKLLGLNTYHNLTMKVKFERRKAFLEVTNDSTIVIV